MDYRGMIPPFELVNFEEMNKKQVDQYFNWFMETKEERLKNLQNYIWNDTKDVVLDKTPESLIKLWEWFQGKIQWEEQSEEEIQAELARRPGWMKEFILADTKEISDLTIIIAYDISVYLGEVLVSNNESVYWGYLRRPKALNGVNRPILLGFIGSQSVFAYTLVEVCIRKSTRCPNIYQLYEVYEIWSKMAC